MGHLAPRGIVAITLLLFVWQWESILAIETGDCCCYSFHKIPKSWEDSNKICQENDGTLVSMETEEEYQLINKTIQSLDVRNNEWYIGLRRKMRTWQWISGHDMDIMKWLPGQPSGTGDCVKMIKHYKGWGLFADVTCSPLYKHMFICEYKRAQKCSNITSTIIEKRCFSKRKQVTTKENTMTPSFSPSTKETSDCSCYSFHHITKNWEDSNKICQANGGTLVSMETEEEYQFINKTIQSLDVGKNEWFIGLKRISGTHYWQWISGHDMTIDKWRPTRPSGSGDCVKMIKHYKGRGLFDDIRCDILYMFICEYKQAQRCPNITSTITKKWCSSQKKQITTSKEHIATTPFSPTSKVGPSISPIENKTVTKGEPILLLCNATGDPAPNVSWSKASGTINPSYVSGKELWILSAKLSDAGKYICTAKNDVSMTTVEAFVTVMLRPHSPVPLSTQITHLTINVYWKKPKSHGYPVLMYSVHRVELDQAGQEVKSRTYHVNEDVHHYEAGDIERGKTYKFYVTAWNTHGESVKDHRKSVTVKVQKP